MKPKQTAMWLGLETQAQQKRIYNMSDFTDAITKNGNDDLRYDGEQLGFSWRDCECCGSPLGGDRWKACKLIDGEIESYSVCCDCINYIANGEEPETWGDFTPIPQED